MIRSSSLGQLTLLRDVNGWSAIAKHGTSTQSLVAVADTHENLCSEIRYAENNHTAAALLN